MRKVHLPLIRPGMLLGKTVRNERGDLLLSAGGELSAPRIDRLRELGFLAAYVCDEDETDAIAIRELVDEQIQREVAQRMRELHAFVADVEEQKAKAAGKSSQDVVVQASQGERLLHEVLDQVRAVLDDVLAGDLVLGLSALKSRDGYAFQHGVDSAALAALLGAKIRLPIEELRSLVTGCLLMDIGNVTVPPELLASDDHLALALLEAIRAHSESGFEIVRAIGLKDVLAAHIPYQHHERQDGGGYPRGLRGLNRVHRNGREDLDGRLILMIAEIASIADVYDALCSDRPYRAAFPVEQATRLLTEQAGTALNREMVDAFLSLVPIFPLGTRVRLEGDGLEDARGVVAQQDRLDAARPVVRLSDPASQADAEELIATAERPDIEVTVVPADE